MKESTYYFQIPDVDGDDDWRTITAHGFEEAAEKACEKDDVESAKYSITKDEYLDEIIIRNGQGEVKRFSITSEARPTYYAREITE